MGIAVHRRLAASSTASRRAATERASSTRRMWRTQLVLLAWASAVLVGPGLHLLEHDRPHMHVGGHVVFLDEPGAFGVTPGRLGDLPPGAGDDDLRVAPAGDEVSSSGLGEAGFRIVGPNRLRADVDLERAQPALLGGRLSPLGSLAPPDLPHRSPEDRSEHPDHGRGGLLHFGGGWLPGAPVPQLDDPRGTPAPAVFSAPESSPSRPRRRGPYARAPPYAA